MTDNVLASRSGMLTALRIVPSSSAARIDCAISIPTLSCASAVEAPRCGVKIKFGAARSGESSGNGSISNRSEEHTSELQSLRHLVCRLLLEKKKKQKKISENHARNITHGDHTKRANKDWHYRT